MKIIFWIAYVLTVAEFTASPINVLRGSSMHLQRFREVHFPLSLARFSAVLELLAVVGVLFGLRFTIARLIGGLVLAVCFVILEVWAIRARRPIGDIAGLGLFIASALVVSLY